METFKKLCSSILILTLIVTMSSGCNVSDIGNSDILTTVWNHLKISEEPQQSYEKAPSNEFFEMKDKASIYQEEYGGDVLYITVGDGIGKNDENETWDNLNLHDLEWYEKNDQKQIECDALIMTGHKMMAQT